jgi:transcription initiation factor TFIIB
MRPVPTEPPGEIRTITGALGVSNPRLEWAALQLYLKRKDRPKSSYQALRAATVYASCRLLGVPRTLKDVSAAAGVRASEIAREYRRILLEESLRVRLPDPAAYIPDIARRADLGPTVERRAIEIVSTLKGIGATAGKAPTTVAAASLYVAYAELHPMRGEGEPTQKSIADAAGVTEVSVRNRSHAIRSDLEWVSKPVNTS